MEGYGFRIEGSRVLGVSDLWPGIWGFGFGGVGNKGNKSTTRDHPQRMRALNDEFRAHLGALQVRAKVVLA